MLVSKTLALRGPNFWLRVPTLEVWVEVNDEANLNKDERLAAWLWGCLSDLKSAQEIDQGLRHEATRLELVLLGLLRAAGAEVSQSRTAPCSVANQFRVVVEYEDEPVGRKALATALALIERLTRGEAIDWNGEARGLASYHQQMTLGPSTRSIVDAARRRGIPFRRLTSGSMVQFGHGRKQTRIQAAETHRTGAIAQEIAQDKELTRSLLRAVGVPVPEGETVHDADHAWEVAQEIGLPVVVKPQDGNQGRGVSTNLGTEAEVRASFESAHEESKSGQVIVETFAPGGDYRVLVIGDRVVAAARREPAQVTGDGVHTVADLIALVNQDPRRGEDHATALSKIPLDAISQGVLATQGFSADSVPGPGVRVLIRRNANLSTGGTACDVTDLVHPEVAARCVMAARMIGLDIAGVDVVASDIGVPLEEQGGVIVEVNAAPGLRMHLQPSEGQSRDVGEAIVDLLYPSGTTGRIPIAAVTGVNGKTTVTRLLAAVMREAGNTVGMTCTDGIYINERRIDQGDCSGPASAHAVLQNPDVDVAVLETARGGIVRAGLAFNECDLAIVTNIGDGDHLGISDINTPEDLARVKGVLVENVSPRGAAVLNAADPLVRAMAPRCRGSVVYFAVDPDEPVIVSHRAEGGRAVFVRHGEIVLAEGTRETGLSRLVDIPITHMGRIGFQVENTLAVSAGAWAMGVELDVIRQAIETIGAEADTIPGRFNLFEIQGATVVVDYGHNTSALQALIEAIEPIPCRTRSIVYSAAGDRRDEDMILQGAMLARHFDHVYLYEDQYMRGRERGEIIATMRLGLAQGHRVKEVHDFQGSLLSVEAALRTVGGGDLLVVQADTIDETVAFIRRYLDTEATGRVLTSLDERVEEGLVLARSRKLVAVDDD